MKAPQGSLGELLAALRGEESLVPLCIADVVTVVVVFAGDI